MASTYGNSHTTEFYTAEFGLALAEFVQTLTELFQTLAELVLILAELVQRQTRHTVFPRFGVSSPLQPPFSILLHILPASLISFLHYL
jgi:hypothetical protein